MEYAFLESARLISGHMLQLTFEDGTVRQVVFTDFPRRKGLFTKLDDLAYFQAFSVVDGVLTWGGGEIDLAPETLYSFATGKPLPGWMQAESPAVEAHEHPDGTDHER